MQTNRRGEEEHEAKKARGKRGKRGRGEMEGVGIYT